MGAQLVIEEFPIIGDTEKEQIDNLHEAYNEYMEELLDEAIQLEIQELIDNDEDGYYDTAEKIKSLSEDVYNNPDQYEVFSYTGTFLSSGEGLNVNPDMLFVESDFVAGDKWRQPKAQRLLDGATTKACWLVGAWCSN